MENHNIATVSPPQQRALGDIKRLANQCLDEKSAKCEGTSKNNRNRVKKLTVDMSRICHHR